MHFLWGIPWCAQQNAQEVLGSIILGDGKVRRTYLAIPIIIEPNTSAVSVFQLRIQDDTNIKDDVKIIIYDIVRK